MPVEWGFEIADETILQPDGFHSRMGALELNRVNSADQSDKSRTVAIRVDVTIGIQALFQIPTLAHVEGRSSPVQHLINPGRLGNGLEKTGSEDGAERVDPLKYPQLIPFFLHDKYLFPDPQPEILIPCRAVINRPPTGIVAN